MATKSGGSIGGGFKSSGFSSSSSSGSSGPSRPLTEDEAKTMGLVVIAVILLLILVLGGNAAYTHINWENGKAEGGEWHSVTVAPENLPNDFEEKWSSSRGETELRYQTDHWATGYPTPIYFKGYWYQKEVVNNEIILEFKPEYILVPSGMDPPLRMNVGR